MTDIDRSDELRAMYADETEDPLAEMFSGPWLDTQEFPPLEYAVPGIVPEGFGLLVSVSTHLTHVYTKLGLTSRVQLAQEAARHT